MMVSVPLWILVHVGGFSIYSDRQSTISLCLDNGIYEGDDTILIIVFHCKPYGQINTLNVSRKFCLCSSFLMTNVSSTYLSDIIGGAGGNT